MVSVQEPWFFWHAAAAARDGLFPRLSSLTPLLLMSGLECPLRPGGRLLFLLFIRVLAYLALSWFFFFSSVFLVHLPAGLFSVGSLSFFLLKGIADLSGSCSSPRYFISVSHPPPLVGRPPWNEHFSRKPSGTGPLLCFENYCPKTSFAISIFSLKLLPRFI